MLGHLRPGDAYFDRAVRGLDGTKGIWLTIVKLQGDGSEQKLGPNHKDRTCWVWGTGDGGRDIRTRRHVFNLYPSQLNHPDSIAALQERHEVSGQSDW